MKALSRARFENCFCASVFLEELPPISPGVMVVVEPPPSLSSFELLSRER